MMAVKAMHVINLYLGEVDPHLVLLGSKTWRIWPLMSMPHVQVLVVMP
jgi:hypothetical protein